MWIVAGIIVIALSLGVILPRVLRSPRALRVEREILEEGLPTAAPPRREPESKRRASGEFRWTEVVNLTAADSVRRPERTTEESTSESSTPAP